MLTINAITVSLGGRTILDRATATIPPGGRVGLIGRNGAGKSTLIRTIIGEIEPDSGEVDMPRRARLGYIAQEAPSGDSTPLDTVSAAQHRRPELCPAGWNLHWELPAQYSQVAHGEACPLRRYLAQSRQ